MYIKNVEQESKVILSDIFLFHIYSDVRGMMMWHNSSGRADSEGKEGKVASLEPFRSAEINVEQFLSVSGDSCLKFQP